MKLSLCERESEVVAALRSGVTGAELDGHIASCAACGETRRVARLMLRHAAALGAGRQQLPSAKRIWRKAQAQRQQAALCRATRALVWMRALGAVYVALLLAWCVRTVWVRQATELRPAWSALHNGAVLVGAGLSLSLIVAGAGCLLLLNRGDDRTFVSV